MATIDVLCAIDAAELPALSQDRTNPTQGLNPFIRMIVKDANALSGQAGPELNISAKIGDNVRWRAVSLDSNFDLSVVLYNFTTTTGGNLLSAPQLLGGVNNGVAFTINELMPVQGPLPCSTTNVSMPYDYYQSTVEATRTVPVTYQWWFQVSNNDGGLVGYGMWDPFITISN
jgi:hypothetical protein